MNHRPSIFIAVLLLSSASCVNPFAPGLDTSPGQASCDPSTIDGIFQCLQVSYTFRDTSAYAPLLDPSFIFVYRDYDNGGIDVTWGRDTELRTTFGLFQNAQRLDLIWNNILSSSTDSTRVNVVRGFNLTITFNPSDITRVDGYANLTFDRASVTSPWKIIRWRDESNY
ncbi:MAG: hypothetical protein ABI623_10320 [bacterium]